eukprot:2605183-Rhodomonas_salina.2
MWGTDRAYGATRTREKKRERQWRSRYWHSVWYYTVCLRTRYAMSGTDESFTIAVRCARLWRYATCGTEHRLWCCQAREEYALSRGIDLK